MTPKQKTAVAISALILIGGAGYLYYEFVWKPKHKADTKPEETKKPEEIKKPESAPTAPPAPEKPVSFYGFKPGDMLWTRADVVNVYNYPESISKYRVGFLKKQALSETKFIADSGTKGFVKAKAVYYTPDGLKKQTGDVYIPANQITNVAP